MNDLVRDAIRNGHDPVKVLVCMPQPGAALRPSRGQLQVGDPADFLVVDDIRDFHVLETYVSGRLVAREGTPLLDRVRPDLVNVFHAGPVRQKCDLAVVKEGQDPSRSWRPRTAASSPAGPRMNCWSGTDVRSPTLSGTSSRSRS